MSRMRAALVKQLNLPEIIKVPSRRATWFMVTLSMSSGTSRIRSPGRRPSGPLAGLSSSRLSTKIPDRFPPQTWIPNSPWILFSLTSRGSAPRKPAPATLQPEHSRQRRCYNCKPRFTWMQRPLCTSTSVTRLRGDEDVVPPEGALRAGGGRGLLRRRRHGALVLFA